MFEERFKRIEATIRMYFEGLFHGDIDMLKKVFDERCFLYGDINGDAYVKSLGDYLNGVQNRQSPRELQEPFEMDILAIEILGLVAIAKLHVPMLGFNYYDFLSLTEIQGEWKIVNKVFVHVKND